MIHQKAHFTQLASLIWVFSMLTDTQTNYANIWNILLNELELVSEQGLDSVLTTSKEVISMNRIGKSLFELAENGQSTLSPEEAQPNFFKVVQAFVRDEKMFRKVMSE